MYRTVTVYSVNTTSGSTHTHTHSYHDPIGGVNVVERDKIIANNIFSPLD